MVDVADLIQTHVIAIRCEYADHLATMTSSQKGSMGMVVLFGTMDYQINTIYVRNFMCNMTISVV